jgi:hypothetical protein
MSPLPCRRRPNGAKPTRYADAVDGRSVEAARRQYVG